MNYTECKDCIAYDPSCSYGGTCLQWARQWHDVDLPEGFKCPGVERYPELRRLIREIQSIPISCDIKQSKLEVFYAGVLCGN